jgi:uncharacterized SAM-binding protein YcdF (DUF218 family)
MSSFLYDLKGQLTIFNILAILLILACVLHRYKLRKAAIVLVSISLLSFLVCSTPWVPNYLAASIEKKYSPFKLPVRNPDTTRVLIHVLGSGYTLDKRLPATAQIGLVALGRLAEGIRIHRAINNSILICSGYSPWGLETQAQVTKKAAVVLGVDPLKVETLDEPSTTQEEAKAFSERYGKSSTVILVTDALHMPRAMRLFGLQGFHPVAAPTNFKVNEYQDRDKMYWWPSLDRIGLMNYVIHEWLGSLKTNLFH